MKKADLGKEYLANFTALVQGLRKETGTPALPLVLGSYRFKGVPDDLRGFTFPADKLLAGRKGLRGVLQGHYDAQKALAPAKMVRLQDLERVAPNNPHYNTKGQLTLGRLFAEAYIELTKARTAPPKLKRAPK